MFSFIIFIYGVWTHDQYILLHYYGFIILESYQPGTDTRLVKSLWIYRPNTSCYRIFQGLVDLLALCYGHLFGFAWKGARWWGNKKIRKRKREGRQRNQARVSSTQSANHLSPRYIFYVVRITDENAYAGSQAKTYLIPEIDFTYALQVQIIVRLTFNT